MEKMIDIWKPIRDLDEEINKGKRRPMMSIMEYMKPLKSIRFFHKEGVGEYTQPEIKAYPTTCLPEKRVHNDNISPPPLGSEKTWYMQRQVNTNNRVRMKNIETGVLFEFTTMVNSARFLGVKEHYMRFGINDEEARVFRVGEEKFVFEYDGVERPNGCGVVGREFGGFLIEIVSSTGRRRRFESYLSAAKQLGLLSGHIMEEEDRWKNNRFAKKYVTGKEVYTIEFNGEGRDIDDSNGIHCHWKGIYTGDWEKIKRVRITQGNPQPLFQN